MSCNLLPSSFALSPSLRYLVLPALAHCQIPETLYLIQLVLEACVEAGASLLEIQVDRE